MFMKFTGFNTNIARLYCLTCVLLLWSGFCNAFTEETSAYTIVKDQAQTPILTPDLAERKVLKLRLANGLEAYLISDPKADKSAAALTVKAGSWDNPKEFPGIAHFLEHMLFLGTKKYPKESDQDSFITQNGGVANAFTADSFTSYMFSVNNSAFEEGLDRFSYFFKEPLFNPSGVARELQAIDQEYAKNLENDDFRLLFVDKTLSNPEHPYTFFNIGNSATLAKVSRDTLIEWYHENYSANLMRLIVYSALPMEKLKELVVADFKDVPNTNKQPIVIDTPIFTNKLSGQMVYIEPIMDSRRLIMIWELPAKFAQMLDTQPSLFLCHLLGHEGEESLLAQLKREKLAEGIACQGENLRANSLLVFFEVELTDDGVKHVDQVAERVFQAIANIKQKEIPPYVFDELHRMSTISYQYQPRMDAFRYVMSHARWTPEEPIETYPEQTRIIQRFDPKAVKEMLDYLTPQKAHIYLEAPSALTGVATDQQEKWMGAKYTVKPIDKATFDRWTEAATNSLMDLPAPNRLIPQQLSLIIKNSSEKPNQPLIPHPKTIVKKDTGTVYFAQDLRYLTPEVSWIFEIKTPHVQMGNVVDNVLADLYVKSINEALKNLSYPAALAGLSYNIDQNHFGINLSITGYSENADLLFDEILKRLKTVPTEDEFNLYKQSLTREYQDFEKQPPIKQASDYLTSVLHKKYTKQQQKAQRIKKISYDKFKSYVAKLYDQIYVEGIMYGNMAEAQAETLANKLITTLGNTPYPKGKTLRPQIILLSNEKGPFYLDAETKAQGNAAILAIENGSFSFKEKAAQQILMQAMKGPFFATLRTKQQTGYLVSSGETEMEKQLINLFYVQSNTHTPRDLLARFDLFIESYLQELTHEIPEEGFNLNKQTLIENLQQPPKSVAEMGKILFKLAFDQQGDFDWYNKRIQGFQELTYPEFISIVNKFMGRQNKRRVAILLQGSIPQDKEFKYNPIGSIAKFRQGSKYTN
jgi:insulysin